MYRTAILSSNINVGLFSTKSISGNFFKDILFKFTGDFKLFTSAKSINNIAVKIRGLVIGCQPQSRAFLKRYCSNRRFIWVMLLICLRVASIAFIARAWALVASWKNPMVSIKLGEPLPAVLERIKGIQWGWCWYDWGNEAAVAFCRQYIRAVSGRWAKLPN